HRTGQPGRRATILGGALAVRRRGRRFARRGRARGAHRAGTATRVPHHRLNGSARFGASEAPGRAEARPAAVTQRRWWVTLRSRDVRHWTVPGLVGRAVGGQSALDSVA